jgi:Subtilase family/Secretion system C-terminal sorting domain
MKLAFRFPLSAFRLGLFLNMLLLMPLVVFGQRVKINKEWELTTTQGIYGQTLCSIDPYGNLVSSFNNIVGNSANITVTNISPAGNIDWQAVLLNTNISNSYLVDQVIDLAGNLYIVSALSNGSNHDIFTAKYDNVGQLIWSHTFNGSGNGNDVPATLKLDNFGNVYVAGNTTSSTLTDFIALKYDSNGILLWTDTYDFNGYADIATDLQIDNSGNIWICGTTSESMFSADFTIRKLDASGIEQGTIRHASPGLGLDLPVQMVVSNNDNIFLIGTTQDGTNKNIKLLSLDNNLTMQWVFYKDNNGLEDAGNGLMLGFDNSIYLTGFISRNSSKMDQYAAKLDASSGSLIWEHTKSSRSNDGKIKGNQLAIDSLNQLYIVADNLEQSQKFISCTLLDINGETVYSKDFFSDKKESCRQFILDAKEFYFVAVGDSLGMISEKVMKASVFELTEQEILFQSDTMPFAIDNEILVRFAPELLDSITINNKEITWGRVDRFLDQDAVNTLSASLGFDFGRLICYKMHPNFTPTDSFATNRYGNQFALPDLFASFVILLDQNANEDSILSILSQNYGIVTRSSYNHLLSLSNCPGNAPNDTHYNNGNSAGLMPMNGIDNANINIECAWEHTTGSSSIVVGVFDTGINQKHEDLSNEEFTSVKGGYNYFAGEALDMVQSNDQHGHGSVSAGIIGAWGGNNKGIAGIAGGSSGTNAVSLYDMKIGIFNESNTLCTQITTSSIIAQAINEAAGINSPYFQDNFDIINASFDAPSGGNQDLLESFQTLYKSGAIIFAASGNEGTVKDLMPQGLPDRYLIRVGANNATGDKAPFSNMSERLDVIAPGTHDLYQSLSPVQNDYYVDNFSCQNILIDGTSFANPHAAGVGALLLSYTENVSELANEKLTTEDVEHLLQYYTHQSTSNTNPPFTQDPHNQNIGWGRIDAGSTIEHILYPEYLIKHYTFDVDANIDPENNDLDDVEDELDGWGYFCLTGNINGLSNIYTEPFEGLIYNIQKTFTLDIPIGYNIISVWPNGAETDYITSTNLTTNTINSCGGSFFTNFNTHFLPDANDLTINSFDVNSAQVNLTGSIIRIVDPITDNVVWYPMMPGDQGKMSISVYLTTNEVPNIPNIVIEVQNTFKLFPNPFDNLIYIDYNDFSLPSGSKYSVFNLFGELVVEDFVSQTGLSSDGIKIDLSFLSTGCYLFSLENEGGQIYSQPIIKL